MLRIIQNQQVAGAKSYYSTADYYGQGQELAGYWRGRGAKMLGLTGAIEKDDWESLCDHVDPCTQTALFQRKKDNRTVGYDLNFHVPKSLSLLYGMTQDERFLDAFRESVGETMRDIELETKTRVRKAGQNDERVTGNLIWGEFTHLTSRPVDGNPDPHLHAHCFAFNATWDNKERRWKAAQFRDLKRDAPYFEALFHARLAHRIAAVGLPVERTKNGWEIAGLSKATLGKFSRRTAEIEAAAKEKGIDDPRAKAELGAKTRSRKAGGLSMEELRAIWRSRLDDGEHDGIAILANSIGGSERTCDQQAAVKAVDHALSHEFERRSVVPERTLMATVLRQAFGQATPDEVLGEVKARGLISGERNGQRVVTTRDVLAEERRIIDFARSGRGTCRPLGTSPWPLQRIWLNAEQRAALRHILDSRDRVIAVRGAAGVGKTSLMQEAAEAIEANGTKVFAFAPTAAASRGVLKEEGFKEAETVARLLTDERLQSRAAGQLLWIDEAGLLGAKTTAKLFDVADRIGARVLLTGDRRQHGSVERGALLKLLETEAGVKPAEVREIQRQKDQYKAAVKALSMGRGTEGFGRLDALGWIRESAYGERYRELAASYVEAVASGKSALVVSPTHAEGDRTTAEIRRLLKARRLLGANEHTVLQLKNSHLTEAERADAVNFRQGDVLQFHQNAKGFRRGERVQVDGQSLPLDQAERFTVFRAGSLALAPGDLIRITHNGFTSDGQHRLNNGALYHLKGFDGDGNLVLANGWVVGKQFGHLAHGAVVTSHAAQGKTVDRVFVAQSAMSFPASSREQFYVSCSRGREAVTIYCDDKQALREAVGASSDRMTATELANGHRRRHMARERDNERRRDRKAERSYEVAHVR